MAPPPPCTLPDFDVEAFCHQNDVGFNAVRTVGDMSIDGYETMGNSGFSPATATSYTIGGYVDAVTQKGTLLKNPTSGLRGVGTAMVLVGQAAWQVTTIAITGVNGCFMRAIAIPTTAAPPPPT